jgi:hypothetical protein
MIPESIARLLSKVPPDLVGDLFALIEKALAAPNPKDAIARAAQVLAHEVASEAAVDAMFEARKHVPGTGE